MWDTLCVAIMAYELIVIPLQVFTWEQSLSWRVVSLLTTLFWTADMLGSFFAGRLCDVPSPSAIEAERSGETKHTCVSTSTRWHL